MKLPIAITALLMTLFILSCGKGGDNNEKSKPKQQPKKITSDPAAGKYLVKKLHMIKEFAKNTMKIEMEEELVDTGVKSTGTNENNTITINSIGVDHYIDTLTIIYLPKENEPVAYANETSDISKFLTMINSLSAIWLKEQINLSKRRKLEEKYESSKVLWKTEFAFESYNVDKQLCYKITMTPKKPE